MDDPYNHVWNSDCTVRWDETYFPSEVTQILVDTNADTDETIDKSDSDDSDIGYDDHINELSLFF